MNNQIKISVVIPCYNVEKHIEMCLFSVFDQDLDENEYEVICVNDCSTDNTEEKILQVQKSHKNLILLNQTRNQKQGAARNVGLRNAKGKYIWFIDSDDYITKNCLSTIYNLIEKDKLDILQFNAKSSNESINPDFNKVSFENETEIISGIDYLKMLMQLHWGRTVEVWRKIYKKDFLIKNDLYFPEYVFGTEDVMFFYNSTLKCEKFKHVTGCYYVYRIDNEDSVSNNSALKGLKLADRIISNVDVISLFKTNRLLFKDDNFVNTAIKSYQWAVNIYLKKSFILKGQNFRDFLNKIATYKAEIKLNLNIFQAFLLTQSLLLRVINAIFAELYYMYKKYKRN